MGAAAGAVSGAASVVSTGAQMMGVMGKAAGENAADQAQADRLDVAAQYGKAQADETDVQLRENLNVQLGNIDAVRAAANIDPSSPTTAALRDRTSFISDRARALQVGSINAQAAQNMSDAAYLRQAGSYAIKMGNIAAIGVGAKAVAQTNFSSFGMPG